MADIPRKSEFTLTDEEKEILRKQNELDKLKSLRNQEKKGNVNISEQGVCELLIIDLYYRIGMQDFYLYDDVNSNRDSIDKRAQERLTKRANYSARLQVLLEDMMEKGLDIESVFDAELGDIYNLGDSKTYYHGTLDKSLQEEEIGQPNLNGEYKLKDGISYWSPKETVAKFYAQNKQERENKLEKYSGTIHKRTIEPGCKCCTIAETHGGAFAMWQEELIALSQNGVRFVYSVAQEREDVLDITNFADFVQKRDECLSNTMEQNSLRLPEKTEGLFEYLASIGIPREGYSFIINEGAILQQFAAEKEKLIKICNEKENEYNEKKTQMRGREGYEK